MALFFSADLHIKHANIIRYSTRGFTDVFHMSEELIRRHNEIVGPDDICWNLGDFAMNAKYVEEHLKRLNGRHWLTPGNHDSCHPVHGAAKSARMIEQYLAWGFEKITPLVTSHMINGVEYCVSHMPYSGDHTDKDRYIKYRPEDQGFRLLCGHAHEAFKRRGRMLNIGVDNWDYYPVSEAQIIAAFEGEENTTRE